MISQEDFEKMAPKAPRKANPEVPPPPPPSMEDLEVSVSSQVIQTLRNKKIILEKNIYILCIR